MVVIPLLSSSEQLFTEYTFIKAAVLHSIKSPNKKMKKDVFRTSRLLNILEIHTA